MTGGKTRRTGHTDVVVTPETSLDHPVAESLRTRHAHLARRLGDAVTYDTDVATFADVGTDWAALAELLGPGRMADLFSSEATPPADWEPMFELAGLQLIFAGDAPGASSVPIVDLGEADYPAMRALIDATRPGPFWPRTPELGTYLGVRDDDGTLVAMAGERLQPPGWTEISAVCTLPSARGQGLAGALVGELVRRIHARGDRPFLHLAEANRAALRVYERLGFVTRRQVVFRGFRTPGGDA